MRGMRGAKFGAATVAVPFQLSSAVAARLLSRRGNNNVATRRDETRDGETRIEWDGRMCATR